MSLASLPPVPGISILKSCANTASMSASLPLVTAAVIFGITASLSALDIIALLIEARFGDTSLAVSVLYSGGSYSAFRVRGVGLLHERPKQIGRCTHGHWFKLGIFQVCGACINCFGFTCFSGKYKLRPKRVT